ncbi:tellurite resistance TerB family protein [Aestuariirhabdus sp. Z084]|uniref:tellurite resistance TerB family protein n=1 Tax=Aestuariirhabdus haliotis TaxID=2918751 RepID=UPI00201B3A21|nr:tellurite resistance TerB family protein [Aestuariirhabdus haliotis]MCL6416404.1 tellurite resistance TerB family protein [Aestuariirhabdus haliotis]MCL6420430.1 tellurite resistance TerB family protein [Aestuariirhabdus haliotis]
MTDMNKLLGQLLGSGAAGGFAGGLAGGLASSLLTSKSGRKLGKSALKVGGVAAVGALAYTAYKRYSDNQNAGTAPAATPPPVAEITPAPAGSAFMPAIENQAANEALGLTLIRAMIAAARSDGRLDAQESQAIFQRIEALGLDAESQNILVQEMGHPADVDAIVNSATCPEVAAEIYIASLLAIEVDSAAERAYLSMLAARLQLPPGLVSELDAQVEAQKNAV